MSLFLECLIIDYLPYLLPRYILVFDIFFFGLVWFGLVRCLLFVVVCPHRIRCHATGTVCRSFDLVGCWNLLLETNRQPGSQPARADRQASKAMKS